MVFFQNFFSFLICLLCVIINGHTVQRNRNTNIIGNWGKRNYFVKYSTFHIKVFQNNETKTYCILKIKELKNNLKNVLKKKWDFFFSNISDENIDPFKNCCWEITVYNFFLKKKKKVFVNFLENGEVNTSDNLYGMWNYDNSYITWFVKEGNKKVFYTAELIWNGKMSKMIKGIIYEEKKRKFLPDYLFRRITGSFVGTINHW